MDSIPHNQVFHVVALFIASSSARIVVSSASPRISSPGPSSCLALRHEDVFHDPHDSRLTTSHAFCPRLESPPLVTMPRRHVQLYRHTYCTSASTSHCDTSPLFMVHDCPYAFPLAMCSSRGVHAMYFTHQERKPADTLEPRFLVYMRFGSLVCTTSCAHSPSRVGF